MSRKFRRINLESANATLSGKEAHNLAQSLRLGGLAVVSSDTTFALVGSPFRTGVTSDLNKILNRGKHAIPLSFGSIAMAERYVEFNYRELRVLDGLTQNEPVTIMSRFNPDLTDLQIAGMRSSIGTEDRVPVRMSWSLAERQVSWAIDGPITSTALLDRGEPIRDAASALACALASLGEADVDRELTLIQTATLKESNLSTIIQFGVDPDQECEILRAGETQLRQIERLAQRTSLRDVEDWT